MSYILCIETSEKTCSVALSKKGILQDEITNTEEQSHAKKLTLIIDQLLNRNHLSFSNLEAVAVSSGPGSYTGLRIGVSTAKGVCFGKDLPLIAINTLDILFYASKIKHPAYDVYVPNLDARRNEVFMSIKSKDGEDILSTKPVVLDENPLNKLVGKSCLIAGSGSEKFIEFKKENDALDSALKPLAKDMCSYAYEKFVKEEFESVAYFEPTYFKAVHTTVSKKKIFGV